MLSSSVNSRGDNELSTDNDDEDYDEVNDDSPNDTPPPPPPPPTLWRDTKIKTQFWSNVK